MAKASFASKDASKGGGGYGLTGGRWEVLDVRSKVYGPQASKDGHQSDPFTCIEFDLAKLDDKWNRASDDILQHQFPAAFAQDEDGKKVLKARPGKASGPDDDEPTDLCADKDTIAEMVDIEGNTIVADEGYKLWSEAPWIKFTASLEDKGFKPDVNRQGFAPNYVGMKFGCRIDELEKPKNWKKAYAPTAVVVTEINVYPYEAKKGASGKTSTASSKANGSAASAGVASGNGSDLFSATVKKFAADNKGKKLAKSDLVKQLGMKLMAVKEIGIKGTPPLMKAHVNSEEGLVALSMEHGFEVDTDTWEVSF